MGPNSKNVPTEKIEGTDLGGDVVEAGLDDGQQVEGLDQTAAKISKMIDAK